MATSLHRSPLLRLLRRSLGILSALLSALLVAGFIVTGFAGTAHAEDGYRYWNYFHLQGNTWEFSQVGPGGYKQLKDGDVEAYRFGTSASSDTNGIPPRADLSEVSFDSICADDEAAGEKRVAVVLDYGTEADADGTTPPAPRAECAVVNAKANGQQVLEDVADVRSEDGLTCALDGYPVKGCGGPVTDVKTTDEQPVAFDLPGSDTGSDTGSDDTSPAASEESDNGLLWPLVGVAVLVVVIAGAGLALSRRNKTA